MVRSVVSLSDNVYYSVVGVLRHMLCRISLLLVEPPFTRIIF
jgi:hypothetical protein